MCVRSEETKLLHDKDRESRYRIAQRCGSENMMNRERERERDATGGGEKRQCIGSEQWFPFFFPPP